MRKTIPGLILLCFWIVGCNKAENCVAPCEGDPGATPPVTATATPDKPTTPIADLKPKVTDLKPGAGPAAADGDMLVVLYKGTLKDGTEFDSNFAPDKAPFSFVLGTGSVIKGWDLGMPGMKVGGERKLEIPAGIAYGDQAQGSIPANSDLTFEVKLLYIVKKGDEATYDSKDIKVGTGAEAKTGDTVSVHYTGTLLNKKKFDSSLDRGQPFEFTLGAGSVIKGWDAGVVGMKVGGKRHLILPPAVAYGEQGSGATIPPNSVLEFDIELLAIKK